MRAWITGVLAILLLTAVAGAQSGTATGPANADAPKAAAEGLAAAIEAGDAGRIHAIVYVQTPGEQKLLDAMADMAAVLARLRRQAIATFGPEQARDLIGDPAGRAAEASRKLQAAQVSVEEDTAILATPDGELTLRRIGGQWKVPMAALAKNVNPATLDQALAELAAQQRVYTRFMEDMAAGKYKSAEAASTALQDKMLHRSPATTGSSTGPASQPGR